jgi:hypothetical protein
MQANERHAVVGAELPFWSTRWITPIETAFKMIDTNVTVEAIN